MANKKKIGRVYLVGAGPGDLGLVTLRAKECIERADVIVYDHLANPEMLGWAREDAEIIYAGKKAGEHALKQDEINKLLVEKAREGVHRARGRDWLRSSRESGIARVGARGRGNNLRRKESGRTCA